MKILPRGDLHTSISNRAGLPPNHVALIAIEGQHAYIYRWSDPMRRGTDPTWRHPIHHTELNLSDG